MAKLEIDKNFLSLGDKFKEIDKVAPQRIYETLNKAGNKIKRGAKDISPDGAPRKIKGKIQPERKKLKNRWRTSGTEKVYDTYENRIFSAAPHFHLVERGHKIVPRRAKLDRNNKYSETYRVKHKSGKTRVEGTYFFDKYYDSIESDINTEIEDAIDKIFEGLL